MSIASVASNSNWWYQQAEATQTSQSSSGTGSTTGAGSVSNTGTATSSTNPLPFFVDFASDLQAMLAQMSGSSTATAGTNSTATTTTTADTNTVDQSSTTSSVNGAHHRRHHGGGDGSIEGDATQLVGEAAQTLQNPTAGTGNVATAANTFATDVVQALQAYGGTAALANSTSTIA